MSGGRSPGGGGGGAPDFVRIDAIYQGKKGISYKIKIMSGNMDENTMRRVNIA